jgi:hypothetical protein
MANTVDYWFSVSSSVRPCEAAPKIGAIFAALSNIGAALPASALVAA